MLSPCEQRVKNILSVVTPERFGGRLWVLSSESYKSLQKLRSCVRLQGRVTDLSRSWCLLVGRFVLRFGKLFRSSPWPSLPVQRGPFEPPARVPLERGSLCTTATSRSPFPVGSGAEEWLLDGEGTKQSSPRQRTQRILEGQLLCVSGSPLQRLSRPSPECLH